MDTRLEYPDTTMSQLDFVILKEINDALKVLDIPYHFSTEIRTRAKDNTIEYNIFAVRNGEPINDPVKGNEGNELLLYTSIISRLEPSPTDHPFLAHQTLVGLITEALLGTGRIGKILLKFEELVGTGFNPYTDNYLLES